MNIWISKCKTWSSFFNVRDYYNENHFDTHVLNYVLCWTYCNVWKLDMLLSEINMVSQIRKRTMAEFIDFQVQFRKGFQGQCLEKEWATNCKFIDSSYVWKAFDMLGVKKTKHLVDI